MQNWSQSWLLKSLGGHLGSFRPPEEPKFTIWVPPAQICPHMGRPMGVHFGAIFTRWVAFRSIVFQCCFGLAFRVGFGRAPDQKSSDSVREVLQNLGFREGCKNSGFGLHFGSILAPFLAPWGGGNLDDIFDVTFWGVF